MTFHNIFPRLRMAAPAPAREVLRENTESLTTADAIESPSGAAPDRVAELRRRVQQGQYTVDLETLSAKIVARHLAER